MNLPRFALDEWLAQKHDPAVRVEFDLGQILLLEDEPFIAIDLEEMLAAAGAESVVSLDTSLEAKTWLATNAPQLAIIDPRLRDGICSEVASLLVSRGVPFLVYSGDPRSVMEPGSPFFSGAWISKPCQPEAMLDGIRALLASSES